MTPDRRKLLRGLIASMAAAGAGSRVRADNVSGMHPLMIVQGGKLSATLLTGHTQPGSFTINPLFYTDQIGATASKFQLQYGSALTLTDPKTKTKTQYQHGAGYSFGMWLPTLENGFATSAPPGIVPAPASVVDDVYNEIRQTMGYVDANGNVQPGTVSSEPDNVYTLTKVVLDALAAPTSTPSHPSVFFAVSSVLVSGPHAVNTNIPAPDGTTGMVVTVSCNRQS